MEPQMSEKKTEASEPLKKPTKAESEVLQEFVRDMNENAIPEILKIVQKRRALATQSRLWQLKT
jgi:hypothetical protein